MSLSASEFFDPINTWLFKFPQGFRGITDTKVPASKEGHLMLGSPVSRLTTFVHAELSADFTTDELSIGMRGDLALPFTGLVLAFQTIAVAPFNELRANIKRGGDEIVEVGNGTTFEQLPDGESLTGFGTINHTAMFVLGETSLKCFIDS